MRRISLFLKNGFQMMGLAALAPFEFANLQLGREVYRVAVVSEDGRPARSSLGPRIETEAMPNTKKSKYSEARPITTPTAISPGATLERSAVVLRRSCSRVVTGVVV